MQINEIVMAVLLALGIFALSMILHELSHMFACKILRCKVIGWKILLLRYDGQRVFLSAKGRNHCAFITSDVRKMRIIVAAGPAVDFLIACVCFLLALAMEQLWRKYGLFGASCLVFASLIFNLLPATNGDGKMLFGKDGV